MEFNINLEKLKEISNNETILRCMSVNGLKLTSSKSNFKITINEVEKEMDIIDADTRKLIGYMDMKELKKLDYVYDDNFYEYKKGRK